MSTLLNYLRETSPENNDTLVKIDKLRAEARREILVRTEAALKRSYLLDAVYISVRDYFSLTDEQFTGKRRSRKITDPRFIFCWLSRELVKGASWKEIGAKIGKDHSGTIYGYNKAEEYYITDRKFKADLDTVKAWARLSIKAFERKLQEDTKSPE